MKLIASYILLTLNIFLSNYCLAQVFIFDNPDKPVNIDSNILMLEDKKNSLSIDQIIKNKEFNKATLQVPNLGVTSSSWWIKIAIKNVTDVPDLIFKVDFPIIDEIEFYSLEKNQIKVEKGGEYQIFSKRKYKDPNYLFDINIPQGETKTFYLKIKSGEQIMLPLVIGTYKSIFESITLKDWIFGIYFGIIIVMFLYNLFLYFTVKDKSYLYYVIYILCVGLTQTFLHGYTFKYLWPDSPWLAIHSMYLLPSFVGIAIAEFIKVFLQVKEHSRYYNLGLNIINSIYIICILLAVLGFFNLSQNIIHINAMLIAIFALFIAFRIARTGYRPAKFFLLAWTIFLIGVCVFILKDLGILPYNNFTVYMMPAGTAIEVVLISFALADRINILKKEKEESQAQALAVLKENERIIKERNKFLDQQVKKRTVELENSNKNLGKALRELQDTQAQLVNSEKMASLGLLTAGMAHEINNPINFVISSVNPLRRDFGELLNVIQKYEEVDESNFKEKKKEIKEYKEDLDFDYIKEEIESLIQGIGDGANRTADIVKGLKTFSRIDETDLKRVDLNEGIDSTLILLTSLMNNRIIIEKNYENAEPVECYAGKINQVFMNILSNAIYAINKKGLADGEGRITINTREKGDNVIISIKDNGVGIPEEVKAKIFDPFFTTKDVGEGTGLGLSITYNIIESHYGKIDVISETGKGAEFIITLPKLQVNK